MKKLFFVTLALLLMPTLAYAAELRGPNDSNDSLTVTKTEKVKNLYIAASNVTVDASVSGDLVAAGGDVLINGDVEQSLLAAGGTINVRGSVGQNSRVAGGTITINGPVHQDLVVAGGTVTVGSGAVVSGDLLISGGTVRIEGHIMGQVRASGGTVVLDSPVDGNVTVRQVDSLEIGKDAVIKGKLLYSSAKEATVASGAQLTGGIEYTKVAQRSGFDGRIRGLFSAATLISILSTFLLALALLYWLNRLTRPVVEHAYKKMPESIGIGLVTLIVVPVISLILLITLIGMKFAAALGLVYVISVLLGSTLASLLLGSIIMRLVNKSSELKLDWVVALVGAVSGAILMVIPLIGWVILSVLFLAAFGSLIKFIYNDHAHKPLPL